MRAFGLRFHHLWTLILIAVASASLAGWRRSSDLERFDTCLGNLQNIGLAMEVYAVDHEGRYPQTLDELCPRYLPKIPVCPSAGYETYSGGLELGVASPHSPGAYTDFYYLCCYGNHHPDAALNAPRYSSIGMGCMWRDENQRRRAHGYSR